MNAFQKRINELKAENDRSSGSLIRRIEAEAAISSALIKAILGRGLLCSVWNGENWECEQTDKYQVAMHSLWSTDEEYVYAILEGKRVGWFYLVYGNDGYDLISDYWANPLCDSIWEELKPVMDRYERLA